MASTSLPTTSPTPLLYQLVPISRVCQSAKNQNGIRRFEWLLGAKIQRKVSRKQNKWNDKMQGHPTMIKQMSEEKERGLEIKQRVVHRKRKYLDSAPTALSLEQFKKDERNRRRREACARKKQFLIPREHSMVKQMSEEKETGLEIEQRVVHRKRKSLDSVPTLLSLEQSKKDERNKRRREAYARKKQLPIPGVVYIAPSVVEPVLVDLHDKGKEIVSRFSIFEIVSVRGCFGLCYLDFIFNLVRAFS